MTRARCRRTTALALGLALLGLAAPAASAGRCDTVLLETLTPHVPAAPSRVVPGRTVVVAVDVVRLEGSATLPAEGIDVLVSLTGGVGDTYWGAYATVASGADGRAVASLAVPRTARGAAELDVEVTREVVDLPCAGVEEHGRVTLPWGTAR